MSLYKASQIVKIRSVLETGICKYFRRKGFIEVDLPIMTSSVLKPRNNFSVYEKDGDLLKCPSKNMAYLRQTTDLHMPSMVSAMVKVFSVGPCFSTKNSSSYNLNEYWTVSCEEAFLYSINDYEELIKNSVDFLTSILHYLLLNSSDILSSKQTEYIEEIKEDFKNIQIIDYDEVSDIFIQSNLIKSNTQFLKKEERNILRNHFSGRPYIIKTLPYEFASFIDAPVHEIENRCYKYNLILKDHAILKGSLKDNNYENMLERYKLFGGDENYMAWFFEVKKWGCPPTGGFKMGLESLMNIITNVNHINDVVAYPRSNLNCKN